MDPSIPGVAPGTATDPAARRRAIGRGLVALLRATGTVALLLTLYYLLPLDHASDVFVVVVLACGVAGLVALIVFHVHAVTVSSHPVLRAVEALSTSVSLFLLLFAAAYVGLSHFTLDNFGQPLTHTDALYFTVTIFSTVGFGDITAKSEIARLVTTGQMVADLVVIGVAIKAVTAAARRGSSTLSRQV